jgi:uncharacterized protein
MRPTKHARSTKRSTTENLDPVFASAADLATAPVTRQLAAFEEMVLSNPVTAAIVPRLPTLAGPGCYLAAGALVETVWNCLTGRDAQFGIRDYDLNYHDDSDLSWAGEDRVIRRARALFADVPALIEVRNEARVHLWYPDKFGAPCPPYPSTEAAISTFPSTSSCFGIRPGATGLEIYAPYGFSDLFALRTRPNPILAPRAVYAAKTARWKRLWPELTVLPWPDAAEASANSVGPGD